MQASALSSFIQQYVPASPAVLETITQQFQPRQFQRNEVFLKAGAISREYLFLADGWMRAFVLDPVGNDITTNFFGANRAVFEVASFFTQTPASETIQAMTDAQGWVISFGEVNRLFHAVPEFREFGRAMIVREFALYKQRTLSLIHTTAEQRYRSLLKDQPDVFQHAPLKQIATFLGITDTSLSRIRRQLVGTD